MKHEEKILQEQIVNRNEVIHLQSKSIELLKSMIEDRDITIRGQKTCIEMLRGTDNEIGEMLFEAAQCAMNDYSPVLEAEKILKEAK